jgi:Sulfotransferase family
MLLQSTSSSRRAVFLVGCPRSGTTLLQSMLAAHSQIESFPESKFFLQLVSTPDYQSKRYAMGLISPQLIPCIDSFLQAVDHPEWRKTLPPIPLIGWYTRWFLHTLDRLTQLKGKQFWLEKTPDHLRCLKYIEQFVEPVRPVQVIHIVRDGKNVIASLYSLSQKHPKFWGKYFKSLDACIDRWLEDVELTKASLKKPNHTLVRYEDLITQPDQVLADLCLFLGIPSESAMLENYSQVVSHLVLPRESWKTRVGTMLQINPSQTFTQVFDADQQDYVLRRIAGVNLELLQGC